VQMKHGHASSTICYLIDVCMLSSLITTLEVSDEMTPHLINYCYQARWVGVSHSVVVRIVLSCINFILVNSFVW